MYDLTDYYRARIEALQNENHILEKEVMQLATFAYELTEDDCPDEYKSVVKGEINRILSRGEGNS